MPFGEYEDMDACMLANKGKDDPGAYCASIHHEITGKWPTEEGVRTKLQAEYKKRLNEGFAWLGEIDITTYDAIRSGLVKVVALHPITTYHPGQWPEIRHYVEPQLELVAETFKGGYISLDHYWIYNSPYEILESKWDPEDLRIEMLCYVPPEIVQKIKEGLITKVSVDMDWEILRNLNGVVPEGLKGLGVSFLEKLAPGDAQTSVALLNSWGLLIAKTQYKGRPETIKLREGILPSPLNVPNVLREFFGEKEHILGFYRDPAAFLDENFQSFWLDMSRGIQAIMGRLRSQPETKSIQAIFFSKKFFWTQDSIREWFEDHPRYISSAYQPKLLQESTATLEKPGLIVPPPEIRDTVIKLNTDEKPKTQEACEAVGGIWENEACTLPIQEAKTKEECEAQGGTWADGVCTMPKKAEEGKINLQNNGEPTAEWCAANPDDPKCKEKVKAVEEALKHYTPEAADLVRKGLKEGKIKFQDVLPTPTTPPEIPPKAPPEVKHPKCAPGSVWDKEQEKCVIPAGAVDPTTEKPPVSPSVGEMVEAGRKLQEMRTAEEVKTELTAMAKKRDELYAQVDALYPIEDALRMELEAIIQAEVGQAIAAPTEVAEGLKWLITDSMPTLLGEQAEEGPFQCPYCEVEPFETKDALEQHIATDHAKTLEEYWTRSYRKPKVVQFVKAEAKRRISAFLETRLTPGQKMQRELTENRRVIASLIAKMQGLEHFQTASPHHKENYEKLLTQFTAAQNQLKAKDVQLLAVTGKLGEYAEIVKGSDAISRQEVLELMAPTFPLRMGSGSLIKTTVSKGCYMPRPGLSAHTILRNRLEMMRRQVKDLKCVL